jgi:hypothetical protein
MRHVGSLRMGAAILLGLHRKVVGDGVHSGRFQGRFSQARRRQNIPLVKNFNPLQNEPVAGLSGERSGRGCHQFVRGR